MIPLGNAYRHFLVFPLSPYLSSLPMRWSLIPADLPFAQSRPEFLNPMIVAGNRGWDRLYKKEEK